LTKISVGFEEEFFKGFYEHLLHIPTDYFDSHRKEDILQRIQQNQKIREGVSANQVQSLLDIVFLVNFLILMLYYDLTLGFIGLFFILLSLLVTIFSTGRIHQLEDRVFSNSVKANDLVLDTISGIHAVKLLNAEKQKYDLWQSEYVSGLKELYVSNKAKINTELLIRIMFTLGQVTVLITGAYFVLQGKFNSGEYVAFITLFSIAIFSLGNVSRLLFIVTDLLVAYERLNDIFSQKREPHNNSTVEKEHSFDININALFFHYANNDEKQILSNINLLIPHGKKIGIVGRNGCGKTTLVNLIAGLYTQYEGSIKLGGKEVNQVDLDAIRRSIHLIPQDIYIFSGSIRDNILVANKGASEQQLQQAIEKAGLENLLASLYFAIDHHLAHNGKNLSGGERRKIAFARLFIAEPEIIILDEGSNALDIKTERALMQNVNRCFIDKTIIYITHRLYTVKNVDEILVLENGTLKEQGPYDQLMQKQGLFYDFINTYTNY